jgi:hypothetical protein
MFYLLIIYSYPAFLIFIISGFCYFPILGVRNTIRENTDKALITLPQIILEFVVIFTAFTVLAVKYNAVFQIGNE